MDKNKKTTEDDLEEKDVIIGAEEADDEIEDDDLEEDDSYEEEAEEEEEEPEEEPSKNSKPQKSKPSKPSKPQKEPKKKAKKKQEEYEDEEEYEDDDEYDDYDNDEGGGKTKIIIIAVVIAAAVAAAGIFMYNKITKDNEAEQQRQEQIEQQAQADEAQKKIQEANEAEAKKNAEENQDVDDEEEETPTPTEEPVATSTPKPLPTATPTVTPFPEETAADDVYHTPDDNDGVVDVSNEGTTGGISNDTENTQPEVTQTPAGVIFVGDSRFRAMANIATDNSDLWECSSTGDYSWLTGTAFTDVDSRVGKGTKVFISIGINDLTQYQSYASAIVAKAQEWNAKGATVYFVSVGPVGSDSYILNQDIVNYNTYLYQSFANAGVYYIDAYNYLVQAGYDTTDGENYTDATSMALYNYINSLIGR